ncbi:MAG TPA: MFS transporter, partial [Kofleriaceae bacterium]|nr:MFS transporter [Kofleriaceae bacterium]
VAGALVDRIDRRRVLVAADLLASVATAVMAIAAALGSVPVVLVLLLARSAITSAVPPGESAALRRLVADDELVLANSILAATWSTSYVIGMFLGGLAATLGPTFALAFDAASFAIAAGLHATLPPLPVEQPGGSLWSMVRGVPRDTVVALRVAWADRPLLAAVLGKTPLAMAGGAAWVALNLIGAAAHPYGGAALSFGVMQAIRGAGTGIGPAAATWLMGRGARAAPLLRGSWVLMLAAVTGLAFARDPVTLALVTIGWGIGTGTNWVLCHVAIQRHAGDVVIGRLAAFDELLASVAMAGGAVAGAVAAEQLGLAAAPLCGVALGLAALAAAAILVARVPARPDER